MINNSKLKMQKSKSQVKAQKEKSFTLLELLVVIAVIAILAAIVIVSLSDAQQRAREARGMNFSQNIRTTLSNDLVGEWTFDENTISGNQARDTSGNDNHGTIYGATPEPKGKVREALDFDGNDYVEIPSSDDLNPSNNSFTVEAWFNKNSVGTLNGNIIYNKENLYETAAGGGYLTYAWQPYWAWVGGTSFPVEVGKWYHSVVTYDKTKQLVYQNGMLVYSRNQSGDMGSNTNHLRIGARGAPGTANSFFNGLIDEVRIYKRALTAKEIQKLYTETKHKYLVEN